MAGAERIGFTGHQGLTPDTEVRVREELDAVISAASGLIGLSSLAEGADQIFADLVLEHGGELHVVVPALDYESTFDDVGLANYRRLLSMAAAVTCLDHQESNEQAYWAAGKYVVEHSDRVIAVWNGQPAVGLGGTADVVRHAEELGRVVTIVWPPGSARK
ncbi:hypothetical protein [Microbacterium sp. NPDC097977]|uniref:hypothetical protein n=1 Tax=Microbacterium sp. NPDC097977 TaxID=3155686 RepID=UPI00331B918A